MLKKQYQGKKILVTGHTGFKGAMLCQILLQCGAEIAGYSLTPPTNPNLYTILELEKRIYSREADIRDYTSLKNMFDDFKPEFVFHLAAQPIVRESYRNPLYTYETNVMGTVNVCECVKNTDCVRSFLNVTTDKVYENKNTGIAFTEEMPLDGHDPYSNSKSCSELVTHSYQKSFFQEMGIAVSTARAGNVIGGGDFAKDRIIPDCVRAATSGEEIIVRNPKSVRPYQHVLEPLYAYLLIALDQYKNTDMQGSYNVGPDEDSCITTGEIVDIFCHYWGDGAAWIDKWDGGPYEAEYLKLDCSKLKNTFNWKPKWTVEEAVKRTVEWYQGYYDHEDIKDITNKQIGEMFDV